METKSTITEQTEDRAILDHIRGKKRIDPEMAKQIREKAKKITDETYRKHGLLDISTSAIRELRDDE